AAPDVEHTVVFTNSRRGQERAVTVREGLIEASGLRGPERAFVAVPCPDLAGVGRVGDQILLGVHCGLHLAIALSMGWSATSRDCTRRFVASPPADVVGFVTQQRAGVRIG